MTLSYDILISPYPFYIEGIGHIKSPKLKEIWDSSITYTGYNHFLSFLLMDLKTYCESIPQLNEWYSSLSDEEKLTLNMFDLILQSDVLQFEYQRALDFFFVEKVGWDNNSFSFITYGNGDTPVGSIDRNVWHEICDIITQRCGIKRDVTESVNEAKVKSNKALEILRKIKKGKQQLLEKKPVDKDASLPNIISKVAVMANSINYTNVWDLTVFQLYEQFRQENTNIWFDIQKMSVAAYGNKNKAFKGTEWYKTED